MLELHVLLNVSSLFDFSYFLPIVNEPFIIIVDYL